MGPEATYILEAPDNVIGVVMIFEKGTNQAFVTYRFEDGSDVLYRYDLK